MQAVTSEKTFHLKWNNHLQNLSQLFTAIYTSSALADVTLSCRDGAIRAHKLVLSACSPYFEQIFRDNPCKHPVIILKGIPYAEINLLVEFMYKGSVDVQEIDLQSLMHTASELEVRGLAYELRKDASSLLNVNLNEYPTFNASQLQEGVYTLNAETASQLTNSFENASVDRLQQIHSYQQSMLKNVSQNAANEIKRKRKNEDAMPPNAANAVKNILAAAAKELEDKKTNGKPKTSTYIQTDEDAAFESDSGELDANEDHPLHNRDTRFKGKKRVTVGMPDEYSATTVPRIIARSKQQQQQQQQQQLQQQTKKDIKLTIKTPDPSNSASGDCEDAISKVIISAVTSGASTHVQNQSNVSMKSVSFDSVTIIDDDDSSAIDTSDENNLLVEANYESAAAHEDEYDSSDSKPGPKVDAKNYKCDICSLSFVRKYHLERHQCSHTGVKPFPCEDCSFSFTRSSHLARHRRTHTGERPYRCEACGRTFTRGDKLKLHLRSCEKDEYVLPSRFNTDDTANKLVKGESTRPGMVSIGHSERNQLMFTSSGDVLLAPRSQSDSMSDLNLSAMSDVSENNQSGIMLDSSGYPMKRGRGRPRKKPLPVVMPLIKKKRGRPPKIIKIDPSDGSSRPIENYNASNLPYGDFSYLTDMISSNYAQVYQNMVQLNPLIDNAKLVALMTQNPSSILLKQNALQQQQIAQEAKSASVSQQQQQPSKDPLADAHDDSAPKQSSSQNDQLESATATPEAEAETISKEDDDEPKVEETTVQEDDATVSVESGEKVD